MKYTWIPSSCCCRSYIISPMSNDHSNNIVNWLWLTLRVLSIHDLSYHH